MGSGVWHSVGVSGKEWAGGLALDGRCVNGVEESNRGGGAGGRASGSEWMGVSGTVVVGGGAGGGSCDVQLTKPDTQPLVRLKLACRSDSSGTLGHLSAVEVIARQ